MKSAVKLSRDSSNGMQKRRLCQTHNVTGLKLFIEALNEESPYLLLSVDVVDLAHAPKDRQIVTNLKLERLLPTDAVFWSRLFLLKSLLKSRSQLTNRRITFEIQSLLLISRLLERDGTGEPFIFVCLNRLIRSTRMKDAAPFRWCEHKY